MTTKREVIQLIESMPDEATLADIMRTLYIRHQVEEGRREIREGKGLTQEEVEQRLSKWLA